MTTQSKILLGVLGAVTVGAIVTVLVAPEKSKEIGQKVKDLAGDWADKFVDILSNSKDRLVDVADRASDEAGNLSSQANHAYSQAAERYS